MSWVMEQFEAMGVMNATLPAMFQGLAAGSRALRGASWAGVRTAPNMDNQVKVCGRKFGHIVHLNGPPR